MIHMIQRAKSQAAELTLWAYKEAVASGKLPAAELNSVPVEIPKDTKNGDFTTTFALACSKALKMPPRNIAQLLLENLELESSYFESAEIAGPGFMNFRLGRAWYQDVLAAVESEGDDYPFSEKAPRLTLKATLAPVDWDFADGYDNVSAEKPNSPRATGEAREMTLIPYGASMLRVTELIKTK